MEARITFPSGNSGLMISVFPCHYGSRIYVDSLVKWIGNKTKLYSLLAIAIGLLLIWISPYGMAHNAGMYFSRFGIWYHSTSDL